MKQIKIDNTDYKLLLNTLETCSKLDPKKYLVESEFSRILLKKLKQPTIEVIGRRWFQKSYGNTYHSVLIYVDDIKHIIPFEYGYGDQYQQTAIDWLIEEGHIKDLKSSNYNWQRIQDDKIDFTVYDVDRKKDL